MAPVPRGVLALYDSGDEETSEDNDVQRMMGFPFAHLGLRLELHDLAAGDPPEGEALADVRLVVLWMHQLDCRPGLRDWAVRNHLAGRRLLVLVATSPNLEPPPEPPCDEDDEAVNEVLRKLGLSHSSVFTSEGVEPFVRVRETAGEWFGFERPLEVGGAAPGYVFVRSLLPANRVLASAWIQDLPGSEADLVVVGPWGGFAVAEYLWGPRAFQDYDSWIIDPLRFLEAVSGFEGMPRVDANVLAGRRVFVAHVDGDGFNSYSRDRPNLICGEVVLKDILLAPDYEDLPQTISFISAEVDPATTHAIDGVSVPVARKILELPHVEAASHAFSHPMDWRDGTLAFEDILVSGRPYRFDRRQETLGSLSRIRELAPADRPPRVMLWSGSCNPDEETLRIVREAGFVNMNGGDPRLDDEYDSWSHVAPPVWPVGRELRWSSGAANDYLMTNEWSPPFTGFRKIIETFKRTSLPRPLTPVDVYYHFYIAEREVALGTLRNVLDWSRRQEFSKLFVSEYLEILGDARQARIEADGSVFRVTTGGKLATVRFDDETRSPDLSRSRGVLGFARKWGSLYVFLDDGPEHVFELGHEIPTGIRLEDATRPMARLAPVEGELLAFRSGGPGTSRFTFAGLEPGGYLEVSVEGGRGTLSSRLVLQADPEGRVALALRLGRDARVGLSPSSLAEYQAYAWYAWFERQGRFVLLVAVLAGIGWGLCRWRVPLMPLPLEAAGIEVVEGGRSSSVEVESEAHRAPAGPGGLPAGGSGPWSASMDMEIFGDEEERG